MINAKDSDFVWVHFNGDVAVGPSHGALGPKPVAILSLQNLNGKLEPGTSIKDAEMITGPRVRLTFTRPESIDIVIKALKIAQKKLRDQSGTETK